MKSHSAAKMGQPHSPVQSEIHADSIRIGYGLRLDALVEMPTLKLAQGAQLAGTKAVIFVHSGVAKRVLLPSLALARAVSRARNKLNRYWLLAWGEQRFPPSIQNERREILGPCVAKEDGYVNCCSVEPDRPLMRLENLPSRPNSLWGYLS